MSANDWKARLGVVYSTAADYDYKTVGTKEAETLPPPQQQLRVGRESKGHGGKVVTLIRGFTGTSADLEALARELKNKCGVGGSAKSGEIIIQGDHRARITDILTKAGYKAKMI